MIDLATILQAIQRFRPEMLQGIMGGGGGGMQSMNGGGFFQPPMGAPGGTQIAPLPDDAPWRAQPFEPFQMPMPGRGGIPGAITPPGPGGGPSQGRSAAMGQFGRERLDVPGLRQPMPDRFGGATGFGGGGIGNQVAPRPAALGGRRMGGAIVRPSPAGGRGNAVDPRKRAPRKPKYGGAASRGY